MIPILPPLNPLPDDIEVHIKRLLQSPNGPALGEWLLELIQNSGHMNSGDDLHWRLLAVVWLAMEYDPDQAWPHLMWLNMGEPVMAGHFGEIFIEAIDSLDAHVKMATWQAQATDQRLVTFFQDFHCIPAQHKLRPLMSKLFSQPTRPETGLWLRAFCQGTAHNDGHSMRPWRLLAAAWYAAAFKPAEGLSYLQTLTNGANTLTPIDNKRFMDAATEANGLAVMIQIIAGCPDPAVKTLLQDFGHPDLPTVVEAILDSPPDYSRLSNLARQAPADAEIFKHYLACLERAGLLPKGTVILDLACGPLAPQTLLLNSAGYKTWGVDLDIPPGYWPLSGVKAWFKRNQHSKAWQVTTTPYYQALAQQVDLKLKWNRVKIKLADLTRLEATDNSFAAVICANHLQHAPDVNALLVEAARVLKPGGLFLANIRPYAALTGSFQVDSPAPWSHLRQEPPPAAYLPLNKWREIQYQAALEK
jgi:SAM-dependent methyltransferase